MPCITRRCVCVIAALLHIRCVLPFAASPRLLDKARGHVLGRAAIRLQNSFDMSSARSVQKVRSVDDEDVHVNVKIENLRGTRRRICAGIKIDAPAEAIWRVVTNYEQLQDFIPNIAASRSVVQPNGDLHLEQVGIISKRLGLRTSIILAVEEEPFERLSFTKVDAAGFSEFEGSYYITQNLDGTSHVAYSITATPLPLVPVFLVMGKLKSSVPRMLVAVRSRVLSQEQAYPRSQPLSPPFPEPSGAE